MSSRAETEYRYEKLTWPEINDAIELAKVCILPCGAIEQHGRYVEALENCGLQVEVLESNDDFPDSCFVEDAAVCTSEFAVLTRPAGISTF